MCLNVLCHLISLGHNFIVKVKYLSNEIQIYLKRKNLLNCEISYFTTFLCLLSVLRCFSLFLSYFSRVIYIYIRKLN
jgi:hypothetical protein